jgi:O-antigen/teichoic acid export membrane protein
MIPLKNPLVRGSLILLSLVGIFNVLNFLYHIVMARMLSLEDFGLLKRVFVFLYLGAILMETFQLVVVKYASIHNKPENLKTLLVKSKKDMKKYSLWIFSLFIILSIPLSNIFHIPYILLVITATFIVASLFASLGRGILQGQQRFYALGFSMISEAILKMGLSAILVFLGFGVFGAVAGISASLGVSIVVTSFFLRDLRNYTAAPTAFPNIRQYSFPVLIVNTALISFVNLDVLIAGSVFGGIEAGIYSIASTIALIVFIGVQPINKVLFPLTAQRARYEKSTRNNFYRALSIVVLIGAIAMVASLMFPLKIVKIFSGQTLPIVEKILGFLVGGTALLSLTSTVLQYKLSLGKTNGFLWIFCFPFLEIVLLIFFSQSLVQYAVSFFIANVIFLIGSLFVLNK